MCPPVGAMPAPLRDALQSPAEQLQQQQAWAPPAPAAGVWQMLPGGFPPQMTGMSNAGAHSFPVMMQVPMGFVLVPTVQQQSLAAVPQQGVDAVKGCVQIETLPVVAGPYPNPHQYQSTEQGYPAKPMQQQHMQPQQQLIQEQQQGIFQPPLPAPEEKLQQPEEQKQQRTQCWSQQQPEVVQIETQPGPIEQTQREVDEDSDRFTYCSTEFDDRFTSESMQSIASRVSETNFSECRDELTIEELQAQLLDTNSMLARAKALVKLLHQGSVRRLSFQAAGCRLVQLALDVADGETAADLASDLRGSVVEAVRSPHANFVMQKIIERVDIQRVPFVVKELSGTTGFELATNEYGCRIFCRLLACAGQDATVLSLIDELVGQAERLVKHKFGHYVMESVLEHGSRHQIRQVIWALRLGLGDNLRNKHAAYVIERALVFGDVTDRNMLVGAIFGENPGVVASLLASAHGAGLARTLSQLDEATTQGLQRLLLQPAAQKTLSTSRRGCRLNKRLFNGQTPKTAQQG